MVDSEVDRFYRELGSSIRRARLEAGLTQSDLGKAIGLTRTSVANVEAGRQHVQAHTLAFVCSTLNKPYEALIPAVGQAPEGLTRTRLPHGLPAEHRALVERLIASSPS